MKRRSAGLRVLWLQRGNLESVGFLGEARRRNRAQKIV